MLTKILNLFALVFGLTLFLFLTFIFYSNASKKLTEYSQIDSNVLEKGIIKTDNNSKIFFIKVSNFNEDFAVYNMTKNYSKLENEIRIGDKIKIYFENSNPKKNEYLVVIQIEKGKEILVSHNKHKITYYFLTLLSSLVFIYIILMVIEYLKYGEFKNPIPTIF
ncbi:MAG: hypothetical protein WBI92_00160 [Cloacibacterium sp.]|uniref:hypothetical protein n=1 Tax=Cloacibacterium sp. TaxID=1913682 RepID=UPI003C733C44